MKISIIAVGKLKPPLKKVFSSYLYKISFYAKVNLVEIKEINNSNPNVQRRKETTAIWKKVPTGSHVLLCAVNGRLYNSTAFSKLLKHQNLTFIVSGSHGVVEREFNNQVSFSKLTMPHQLFRIVLVEQIYRGIAIHNNLKYHK